jgi:hypothetical protein
MWAADDHDVESSGHVFAAGEDLVMTGHVNLPGQATGRRTGRRFPRVAGAGLTIPPAALLAVAFLTGNEQFSEVCFLVISWFLIAWVLAGTQMLARWYDKRSGRPLPPRPAQHGRELDGEHGSRPGSDPTLSEARRSVRARHLPGPGIIQRARRTLPGCQHQRRAARLQVTA